MDRLPCSRLRQGSFVCMMHASHTVRLCFSTVIVIDIVIDIAIVIGIGISA